MGKNGESLLGLVPVTSGPNSPSNGSLAPISAQRSLSRDEQRTLDEYHKEILVIDATAHKTLFGMTKIGQIHQHGALKFDETTGYILNIKNQSRGREHQAYVNEFSAHQIQMLAGHLIGAMEVGGTNIGMEVHRSLYPLPEPPEPRSLWKRLFG
ncbi:MAG: hypothetical protein M1358_16270 [Chloroflexi bacterium]|nr:hypothetical protein [Chloroflexota bacterium]